MKKEVKGSEENGLKAAVSGTGVSWQYFFGSPGYRYYKAEINGLRVERLNSRYAIGNIDEASQTFKTEAELIAACSSPDR